MDCCGFKQKFIELGIKPTKQRIEIMEFLNHLPEGEILSAEDIFIALKGKVNLATIYRNLDVFCHHGLTKKVNSINEDKALYEVAHKEHYHRVVCADCGTRVTIRKCPLGEYQKKVEEMTGYTVQEHRLELVGLCPECQKKKFD